MATVLVLTRDLHLRARFHGALARHHRLLDASRWAALPGTLLTLRVDALLFAPTPSEEGSLEGEMTWLARSHPGVATLLHIDVRGRLFEAFRMGRLGLDGLVVAGLNDQAADIRGAIDLVLSRALTRTISQRLEGRVDALLLRCLARATAAAHLSPTADDLAEAEGVGVGSLRRTLRSTGSPPPGAILRWGRLMRAGSALDRDDQSVERIAHALGYSGSRALSRTLRREVGHAPAALKQRGGLVCVIDAFTARSTRSDGSGLRSG